jgi:hypothetical protein
MSIFQRLIRKRRQAALLAVLGLILVAVPAYGRPSADNCEKIENAEIGQENVTLTVDGISVTFFAWAIKADEPTEHIGFDYYATGDVTLTVKAGRDRFAVGSANGGAFSVQRTDDRSIKAISHVEVCTAPAASESPEVD